jgi:folate-binding protein YgfZ
MTTSVHNVAFTIVSDDIAQGFQALISTCGVCELSWRAKIELTGSDRVRWLNGMITNNVRDLAVGHGIYGFLLNPQGRIQGDMYAYNRANSLLLDTDSTQLEKMLGIFDHYIIMDDVEVKNISQGLKAIGLAGPESVKVLTKVGFQVPELEPLQFTEMIWNSIKCCIVRGDLPKLFSFEIWMASDHVHILKDALNKAGAFAVVPAAWDLLRIAAGIPSYGQDIRERDLPQETEQGRALNFSKGCYIGQEIVERIRSRGNVHRKFSGFLFEGPLPVAGTKIQTDGKDVGEITSATSLPFADGTRNVALGYIRREFAIPGKQLQAGDARLTTSTLPFVC